MPDPEPGAPTSRPRPRILITCSFNWAKFANVSSVNYGASVEAAGGLPLILPVPHSYRAGLGPGSVELARDYAREALLACDGLLLAGGIDYDPAAFGEEPLPGLGEVDRGRDLYETELIRAGMSRGTPILGICRGVQALAIVAGGAVYQDLASQRPAGLLKHRQDAPRCEVSHPVTIEPDTLLARLLGEDGPPRGNPPCGGEHDGRPCGGEHDGRPCGGPSSGGEDGGPPCDGRPRSAPPLGHGAGDRGARLMVNSFHHQAVSRLPAGFRVSAAAPDGVIEAIEAVDRPARNMVLGVQWHPESLWQAKPRFLGLFRGLVEAARFFREESQTGG